MIEQFVDGVDAVGNAAPASEAGRAAQFSSALEEARVPEGYQVHHMLLLDDGGTNATDNLVLIENEPDHKLITRYQIDQTQGLTAGETRRMDWPIPDRQVRVWPETPGGGAHPTIY